MFLFVPKHILCELPALEFRASRFLIRRSLLFSAQTVEIQEEDSVDSDPEVSPRRQTPITDKQPFRGVRKRCERPLCCIVPSLVPNLG